MINEGQINETSVLLLCETIGKLLKKHSMSCSRAYVNRRPWNRTFQCTNLFRLMIIHLQESLESETTHMKHNSASVCDIVKEWITRTWFISETQG